MQQMKQQLFYAYNPFPNYPFPPTNIPSPSPYYPHANLPTSPGAALVHPGIQTTPVFTPSPPRHSRRSEPNSSPLPLSKLQASNPHALPSSRIDRSKLETVEKVIEKYPRLRAECKAGTLAWKVAKEAIFGPEVMKECTPVGSRDKPGLPTKELSELKKVMFTQYPQYWKNPVEFEPVWKRCLESVQQGCKRMRLGKD